MLDMKLNTSLIHSKLLRNDVNIDGAHTRGKRQMGTRKAACKGSTLLLALTFHETQWCVNISTNIYKRYNY